MQQSRARSGRFGAPAFTLMELMASMAIISIVVTLVSSILSQSQKLVTESQAKIRANAAAQAMAGVIRDDIRKACNQGFLCVTDYGTAPIGSRLLVTNAGPYRSLVGNGKGNGVVACYYMVDNAQATGGSGGNQVLMRPAWFLGKQVGALANDSSYNNPGYAYAGPDMKWIDLYTLQVASDDTINTMIDGTDADPNRRLCPPSPHPQIAIPVRNQADIEQLWQVLAANCSGLYVMWTNGANYTGQSMPWYGRDAAGALNPMDQDWGARTVANRITGEFRAGASSYRALWTHNDLDRWPRAIKIGFRLRDTGMPPEFGGVSYEIICAIDK